MTRRLRILSIGIALIGIAFIAAGGFAYMKTQEGYKSLNAFSAAQNVTLTYNDQGQLVDGDDTAEAQAILALLKSDWGFPVVDSELDPNDPVINTATEYMYQMATVTYHTLHATTTVVVPETVEYNGEVFEAGEYEFVNDGRYWVDFDRMRSHLLEGTVRHRRSKTTSYALEHAVYYFALDLDELEEVTRRVPLIRRNRGAVVSFHDADHLPDGASDVAAEVRAHLRGHGLQPDGWQITLVTNLRLLGYVFNPASFYLCRDGSGRLQAVIVEVHNTHRGRHLYTLITTGAEHAGWHVGCATSIEV